jgi:threonine dehydratase
LKAGESSASANWAKEEPMFADLPAHLKLPNGEPDYLRLILSADIYSLAKQTPLMLATNLSNRLGCQVLMKREDLQPVFSFKLRGAFNMMRQLTDEQKWKGVIACSAGNHAQGVALSGSHLSIPCTIVMPTGTPDIKTENVRRLGAKVVLFGANFDEAKAECSRLASIHGLKIIPPFDEPRVIAGQGTVGVEICSQTDMTKVDAVFCCVGGGGLLAGVASYIKRIAPPGVKVIGVETYDGDALLRSLEQGHRVTLDDVGLFSDGTAVRLIGQENFRLCRELADGIVRVDTDEICAAIKDVFEDTRSIPEPAGALAVAGMKRYIVEHNLQGSNKRFVACVSGANMNFSRLRFVAERSEIGQRREILLMVEIPEKPGSFLRLAEKIFPRQLSEFSYRYNGKKERAQIFLSFLLDQAKLNAIELPHGAIDAQNASQAATTSGGLPVPAPVAQAAARDMQEHDEIPPRHPSPAEKISEALAAQAAAALAAYKNEVQAILTTINDDDMIAIDISQNEVAKSHARYMLGGQYEVENERLFQFTFPERPGALLKFLRGLDQGWNVTLFNYRNNGGDTASILVGIQVDPSQDKDFEQFLQEVGYRYKEETSNEVYRKFMR